MLWDGAWLGPGKGGLSLAGASILRSLSAGEYYRKKDSMDVKEILGGALSEAARKKGKKS
jgi:hypothetical protein